VTAVAANANAIERRSPSSPLNKADGRKLPDCYTVPARLRDQSTERLGPFPLFQLWGPATSIVSRWIADATKFVMAEADPTLTLAYLPHLDYDLQRFGPDERIRRSGNR
jgi:hypothetical protein